MSQVRSLIFATCVVVTTVNGTWAQKDTAAYLLESAYWKYWDQYWEAPMVVFTQAKALEKWATENGDCDSMQVAQTLLLSYDNRESAREPLDSVLRMPVWCDTTMHSLWYAIGVRHFLRQEFEPAFRGFTRAEACASGTSQKVTCMQALGAVCSSMGDRPGAYSHFLRAYEADSSLDNPVFLNNLGVMTLFMEQYDVAADWLERAWKSWPEWANEPTMPEHFDQTILTNLLLMSCEVGDRPGAAAWFSQINPKFLSDQDPLSGVGMIAAYLLWVDDATTWEAIRPVLAQYVLVQPEAARELLMELAWLFPELWGEDVNLPSWDQIRSVPPAYRLHAFPDEPLSEVLERREALAAQSARLAARWNGLRRAVWGWLMVGIAAGIVGAVRNARRRAAASEAQFENGSDAIDVLERALTEPKVRWERALEWVGTGLASMDHPNPTEDAKLELLTHREREVFALTLEGMRPKEIARALDCNPSYVYNLRTSIRRKLGFSSDEDMVASWMASKSQKS